jgi:lipoate-protein ligase A
MAFDELMMAAVDRGEIDLALRIFGWSPPCVSVGRLQSLKEEVDPRAVLDRGFHVVRRPTGGRAVLHSREITYSLAASRAHWLVQGSITDSLRRVSKAIVRAMEWSGLEVCSGPSPRSARPGRAAANPCFTSHAPWEITTSDGRKLVGSAQARTSSVFLEHGSIILRNDQPMLADLLPPGVDDQSRDRVREVLRRRSGGILEMAPELDPETLENNLVRSFETTLGHPLREVPTSAFEGSELSHLVLRHRSFAETS